RLPPSAKPPVPQKPSRLTQLAITTAPVVFVLLWSTGFIGARFGLPYIEPLTFLAVRMIFVVMLMAAIALIGSARFLTRPEIGHSLAAGAMVHCLGLGGVFMAISQGVPAGISALIMGLQPILTTTIANRFMGETVTRIQWLGVALGLVGVVLVLHDRSIVMAGSALGWFASFLGLIGITLGTLYQKRYCGGIDWRTGNLVQYFGAGILFAVGSFAFETRVIDCSGRADVLADPALGGDRLCKPFLSGACGHGAVCLYPVRRAARRGVDLRYADLRPGSRAGQSGGSEA